MLFPFVKFVSLLNGKSVLLYKVLPGFSGSGDVTEILKVGEMDSSF